VTDPAKEVPPASPGKPVYYVGFAAGARKFGELYHGEAMLEAADIARLLAKALAQNGYLPAQPPERLPSLLIIYTWGSYNPISEGRVTAAFLDRAALVGGDKFVGQVRQMLQGAADLENANPPARLLIGSEADSGEGTTTGWTPPPVLPGWVSTFASPVNLFKLRSAKNEFLWEQAADAIYFVVASAYDYREAAANRRKLVWRTRMTVSATGVSQEQALPTAIANAASFFGKDMAEAETFTKRTVPEGAVRIGEPKVLEMPASAGPPTKTPRR
jgi:hypothetical protein